jgi:Undecaprenyl-phosphate galactose phosphotransferase WbaP
MLAVDVVALSLVFGSTVLASHQLASCIELIPYFAIVLVGFWAQGLYPGVLRHPAEEMRRIYSSFSIVFLGMASTTLLWRNTASHSLSMFLVAWAAAPPVVLLSRHILRCWLAQKPWWGVPAVVLGSGPTAQKVVRSLRDGMLGIRVTRILASEQMLAWSPDFPQAFGESRSTSLESHSRPAQYVIVAMPERLAVDLRHAIQYYCKGFSHVILVPDMPGLCSLGLSALEIGGGLGVELPQRLFHRVASAVKRIMDVVLGSFALLLVSPLLLLITLSIKLKSKGPVFYRHVRVGRNGESIAAFKFRTMVVDAESVLQNHLAAHPECQLEWQRDHKLKNDPRVIPIGKWLRRFSLDELPQLWNVIAGQMSLVGPRPIIEAEINRYGLGYDLYSRVRPGITGLWQVSGRNNTTYEERVAFDEYYVRNWSVWLDAYILVCTVRAVLTADGAY